MTLCAATRVFETWSAGSGWADPGDRLEVGESLSLVICWQIAHRHYYPKVAQGSPICLCMIPG